MHVLAISRGLIRVLIAGFAGLVLLSSLRCSAPEGDSEEADLTAPWGHVQPADNSTMAELHRVIVSFDETMNTAVVEISGTMAASAHTAAWADGSLPGNLLTISANTAWSTGADQTITIRAEDPAGNPWQQTLTYEILAWSVYGASPEVCDGQDNDFDGQIDEEGVCGACSPTPEICDGCDNDCDGIIDDTPAGGYPCNCVSPEVAPFPGGCAAGAGCQ